MLCLIYYPVFCLVLRELNDVKNSQAENEYRILQNCFNLKVNQTRVSSLQKGSSVVISAGSKIGARYERLSRLAYNPLNILSFLASDKEGVPLLIRVVTYFHSQQKLTMFKFLVLRVRQRGLRDIYLSPFVIPSLLTFFSLYSH